MFHIQCEMYDLCMLTCQNSPNDRFIYCDFINYDFGCVFCLFFTVCLVFHVKKKSLDWAGDTNTTFFFLGGGVEERASNSMV